MDRLAWPDPLVKRVRRDLPAPKVSRDQWGRLVPLDPRVPGAMPVRQARQARLDRL